jgi:hydrogenase maturation protease
MTGCGVLVVGYGNALRTDDGIGWHAAERLAADERLDGAVVLRRHQLTPELALDISAVSLVIFIDASRDLPPGSVDVGRMELADVAASSSSHHLRPSVLVALTQELYGREPAAFIVRCGVASLELGDRLSPVVEAAMATVIDAVVGLITATSPELEPIDARTAC